MTIEAERKRFIDQLIEDASSTRRPREQRIAAALLGLKMLDPAQAGIRYTTTFGTVTATAQHSVEACMLSAEVAALIDELNSSC